LKTKILQNALVANAQTRYSALVVAWKQNFTECTEKRILKECTLSVLEKEILSDGEETDSGS
jgi:hypothetical protein